MDVTGLHERIRQFVAARAPSLVHARAVIAVSGGADSIATAALLCDAGILTSHKVVVAHFDHQLRGGAAAAADIRAVEALCDRYGIELIVGRWDAPRPSEAAARDARYRFLAQAAHRTGALVVVTGHHADDQAETVLMHAMRGAGLHGLRGMDADAPFPTDAGRPNTRLVRPALCLTRLELRAYCDANDLEYVDDVTNADARFARNRIRNQLLPQMELAAPDVRGALLHLGEEAREAVIALEAIAAPALVTSTSESATLSRSRLRALPAAAVPYSYRLALVRLLGDARDFERRHYATMARAAAAATGTSFELPHGVVITVDPDEIIVSLGPPPVPTIDQAVAYPLPFEGIVGAWHVRVAPSSGGNATLLPPSSVLRRRRPGDRITLSHGGHKKLQDDLVDRKIPRRLRDAMPIIAVGHDVLWTPHAVAASIASGRGFTITAQPYCGGER